MRVAAEQLREVQAPPPHVPPSTPRRSQGLGGRSPGIRLPAGAGEARRGPPACPRALSAAGRPAALLQTCRDELARLQDRLAQSALPPDARASLEPHIAELAARLGNLSHLRGRLVQVLLG